MLVKKGDVVIDIAPPSTISSTKKRPYSAGPSETCNMHGVSNEDLMQILVHELDALPGQPHVTRPVTIFRVPIFSQSMKDMVEPKVVSIGPYHRSKESLQAMEKHKRWYLRDFLARKPEIGMGVYLEAMRKMEMQARQCYNDVVDMSSDEFALMLLLDGCFVLELFLKWEEKEPDYVVNVGWGGLNTDLLMIENQIPYSVVHKLGTLFYYGISEHNCDDDCHLRTLVCERMVYKYMFVNIPKLTCWKINHFLHLYQLFCTPLSDEEQTGNPDRTRDLDQDRNSDNKEPFSMKKCCLDSLWLIIACFLSCLAWIWCKLFKHKGVRLYRIPSATELQAAGVIFKEKKNPRHMFDITFKNGVMEIPPFRISNGRKILLANLLLYEQAQRDRVPKIFASYLKLIDYLIDTSDDVVILTHCGSLGNSLPNDDEAARFFNQLGYYTHIKHDRSLYSKLNREVLEYINQPWHRYRAMLVRDYFSNPWAVISFIAAIILLLLTATQTGFSIYPVVHPN